MMVLKNVGAGIALVLVSLVFAGCGAPSVTKSSPLSSKRGVETLDLVDGEIPRWRKTGNITVKAEGDRPVEDHSLKVVVKKGEEQRTISAEGREIQVVGNGGNLKITGRCSLLSVSGSENQIRCDIAPHIEVNGNENDIDFDSVSTGKVNGDGNSIGWRKPIDEASPVIDFKGINNSIEQVVPRYKRKL